VSAASAPSIAGVGRAFPAHYYAQEQLLSAFRAHWREHPATLRRLDQLHRSVQVEGRHLALPLEAYAALGGFRERNDAWIAAALDLGEAAIRDALARSGLGVEDLAHIVFVSVTGVAAPSIDARLVNRLGLRRDIRRTPVFGLGCVAGAAGIALVADWLLGHPDDAAILLSVELCSLTLQTDDRSIPNLIASGLFGDGAAAVVLQGGARGGAGPRVVASRSIFFPETERTMGWDVTEQGFQVVLSGEVPELAASLRKDVDEFLAAQGVALDEIARLVCHPGGPRVIEALEQALGRPRHDFALTWRTLREHGNLSSTSVLLVLRDTLEQAPPAGSHGLLIAMGPGFCAELVLLRW
jgi:alkylresorcinol/alkylpyrone synthase